MSIDVMKQALEALESYSKSPYIRHQHPKRFASGAGAISALRIAIKQVQNVEPAAMRYDWDGYGYQYMDSGSGSNWQTRVKGAEPLYTHPLEFTCSTGLCHYRKPLTDQQIEPIAIAVLGYGALRNEDMELFIQTVRAIEAAHGIKGEA